MSETVHLERFVGKPVHDANGRKIGHLHEARARRDGDELVVVDYLVGGAGLLERFSLVHMGYETAFLLGRGRTQGYLVPWGRMDFSHPGAPRCTCAAAELQRFSGAPPEPAEKSSA